MAIRQIKNTTETAATWGGIFIEADSTVTLADQPEADKFLADNAFLSALVSGAAQVLVDSVASATAADAIKALSISEVNVVSAPLNEPFAAPTYRTKRKGGGFVTVAPGASQVIDLELPAERYVHGGIIVFENARVGDTITGEVRDDSGLIPVPYRAALCEAHPVVANYIDEEPVPPGNGYREINTYPLNAKLTAGLFLRVVYTAANVGDDRKVGLGYYLTKKL